MYGASQQIQLLVNAETQCVFAACLLLGIAYVGRHSQSLAIVGAGALFLGAVLAALFAGRIEPAIMARVGTALTLSVAAALWINAIRFMLLAYDDLLKELRPQLAHLAVPVLSTTNDNGMKNGLLPAWRELRLTRRLLVFTFAGLAIAEVASLVMKTPLSLSVLFVAAIGLKATQAAAVGLWVLADMRTANERLLARSIAEELGVLTASIEHDIKNPLSNLRREIDTANRKYSSDRDISERLLWCGRQYRRSNACQQHQTNSE
jgi:signal transduction histidine kinase